jgi:predicted aldo/keto reductase-like oxidoreductase
MRDNMRKTQAEKALQPKAISCKGEVHMLTRININNREELSALGFGCMRLPTKGGGIDEPRSILMIRNAIDKGINYFDTAYIYQGGRSESVLGKALAGGYRERVRIATKLPPFMVSRLENARKIFATQLSRLQTDYIDYYLLHMLTEKAMFDRMVSIGILTWMEELKAKGTIRNIGFSFHGTKEAFAAIVQAYPWDFCQIQYNYMDENNQAAKSGLLLAASLGIPVIAMEPLRGGRLVDHLPEAVKSAFAESGSRWTPAEWAMRWVLLSGMSNEAQLEENIRVASDAKANALTTKEMDVFARVKSDLLAKTKVPCTACGYCMPCPFGVDIPGCFSCYNDKYLVKNKPSQFQYMQALGVFSSRPANASRCTECGKCESHCPQNIRIRAELKNVSRDMEGLFFKPIAAMARKVMRVKKVK